jgi:hypothetical protein
MHQGTRGTVSGPAADGSGTVPAWWGAEAAHSGVSAARALGGVQPEVRRSRAGIVAVAAAATTVGVVATLATRKAVVLLRTRDTGNGASVDSVSDAETVRQDNVVTAPTA